MINKKLIIKGSKKTSEYATKGALFLLSAIGMNIGNPFECAKRMMKDDFDDLIGKNVMVMLINNNGSLKGKALKIKKGFFILESENNTGQIFINADQIACITAPKNDT